jgi:hypothetical protein
MASRVQGMALQLGWPFWAFIALRVLSGAFAGATQPRYHIVGQEG